MLAPITLLQVLVYALYYFTLRAPDTPKIPIVNARKGELFPYLHAVWRNTFDLNSALVLHKEKSKDYKMRVNILFPGKMILLPANEPKLLIDQPKSVLSMHKQPEQHFQVEYGTVNPVKN